MSVRAWLVKKVFEKILPREKNVKLRRKSIEKLYSKNPLARNIKFKRVWLGGVAAEWAFLENSPLNKAVIYLHGGGYCTGSLTSYRHFTSILAKKTGVRTLNVEYRLAPENPFPAALEDAVAVYKSLLSQGIPPKNIVFVGDSAGGGLCLATALALRENGEALPAAIVLFSPVTDLTLTAKSYKTNAKKDPLVTMDGQIMLVDAYTNGKDTKNPLVSPRFGNFNGFPPILMHTSTDEVLLDDSINLAQKARKDGVEVTLKLWKGMFHVFTIFPMYTPEGKKSLKEVTAYIKQYL